MATIESLRQQWLKESQKEIDELRDKYESSKSRMIIMIVLVILNVFMALLIRYTYYGRTRRCIRDNMGNTI